MRLIILTVSLFAFVGCNPARYPTAADLAAGVELGAVVVHATDVACADLAKGLREGGKVQEAATVAGACSKPLRDAADGLESAARAIDAGTSVSTGDAACAIVNAASAVGSVVPILSRHGVKLGSKVLRYTEFAGLIGGACHGN